MILLPWMIEKHVSVSLADAKEDSLAEEDAPGFEVADAVSVSSQSDLGHFDPGVGGFDLADVGSVASHGRSWVGEAIVVIVATECDKAGGVAHPDGHVGTLIVARDWVALVEIHIEIGDAIDVHGQHFLRSGARAVREGLDLQWALALGEDTRGDHSYDYQKRFHFKLII